MDISNPIFNPNVTVDSKARNTTLVPVAPGQFLMTQDTKCIFYDLADSRIQLTDIIELDTEEQRQNLLAPVNKFYFIKGSGALWRYNNGTWLEWPSDNGSSAVQSIDTVLSVSGWTDGRQAISNAKIRADQNGIVGLSQDISQAEREAAASADMYACGQADGSLTIALGGDKPTCDIPITIILFD